MSLKKLKKNIEICLLTAMETHDSIADKALLVQVSSNGFCLKINRKDLAPSLKKDLNLQALHGQEVLMYAPDIYLDLDGVINNTQHVGKGIFKVFVTFSDTVPQYWKHCLVEMLMSYPDGEFSKLDTCPNIQPSRV